MKQSAPVAGIRHENAVSDVVGAILLISIVTLAMAIVSVGILSQPPPQDIPQVNAIASNESRTILIDHTGGDSLGQDELLVRVNNQDILPEDVSVIEPGNWPWSVGKTLKIDYPGPGMPENVQLVYRGSSAQVLVMNAYFVPPVITGGPTVITTIPTQPVQYYRISASAGPGGSISPSGQVPVGKGAGQSFFIAPERCNSIAEVRVNGISQVPVPSTYTFTNVQSDQNITARFAYTPNFTIAASASGAGVISPAGNTMVPCGGSRTFTMTPNPGYLLTDVRIDSVSAGPVSAHTFTDVDANHTIAATFGLCSSPTASISFAQQTTPPLTIQFTGVVTGTPNPTYQWDFGDGSTSTLENPVHTYTQPYTYTVSLTVSNPCGTNTTSRSITVNPGCTAPVASFSVIRQTFPQYTIQFLSTTSGAQPFTYAWTFGDGSVSTSQNPVHTYPAAGNYTVILTATNACGTNTTTETIEVTAGCMTPSAAFTYIQPTTPLRTIEFTATASGTAPMTYSWNFGDGTTSTGQNPTHTYPGATTYIVTLVVNNECGTDAVIQTVVVNPGCTEPAAGFAYTQVISPTLTVQFTDQSTGTTPLQYSWNFGDGYTSSDQSPVHSYTQPNTYPVTLTVTNDCGASSRAKPVTVTQTYPGGAKISLTKTVSTCPNKGKVLDGSFVEFRSNSAGSIKIAGTTRSIAKNDIVRIVIYGDQTSGELSVSSNKILTLTFNVHLYVNGVLKASGLASASNIQIDAPTKLFTTTSLTYQQDSRCTSTTALSVDNIPVISGLNSNQFRIENMNQYEISPTSFVLRLTPTSTNVIQCTGDLTVY